MNIKTTRGALILAFLFCSFTGFPSILKYSNINGYSDYSQSWTYPALADNFAGGGGGHVSVNITNDFLIVTFSAGFSQNKLKNGNVVQLVTSPGLPDMELGFLNLKDGTTIYNYAVKVFIKSNYIYFQHLAGHNSQPYTSISGTFEVDLSSIGGGVGSSPVNLSNNQNYIYTIIPQDKSTSLDDLEKEEKMESVTYFDGLGRPMQQVGIRAGGSPHTGIIGMNSWKPGNGSAPFYNQNGSTTENNRVIGVDPFGRDELLWECGNDNTSDADGGWNTDYFNIDKNAAYRYSVWVKRTGSQDGTTYHGIRNVNNLSGTSNSNPYFWTGDLPVVGQWYLVVGVVHPSSYGGGYSGISGVYDQNGHQVISGTEFKWQSTTTTTSLRSYLYYATSTGTRQYFWQPVFQKLDGTESSISELAKKAGKADVVTHITYDQFGRQNKDYLPVPFEDGNYGTFRTGDMGTITASYYRTNFPEDFTGMTDLTANPYSEKLFEPSPLSRVDKQAAPGKDWRLGSGHEVEFDYQTNTGGEVNMYTVNLSSTFVPTINNMSSIPLKYPAGELYKTVTFDENHPGTTTKNNSTEEFKDKHGRVILKRTYNAGDVHDTYYLYDNYGNLTYVIPPKVKTSDGISTIELAELCYQYRYDERKRLVEKKIPGKGTATNWESIVYNKLDQPIMTQDPNLKAMNQWLFTKYDAFGRVAYTGLLTRIASRTTLQAEANNNAVQFEKRWSAITLGGTSIYYTDTAYPKISSAAFSTVAPVIHTENYYDSYLTSSAQAGIIVPSASSVGETISSSTKGLPTVSKVRVLDTSNWITTVTAYESKGRPIWTKSVNSFHSTTDLVESDIDFTGKVLVNKTTHSKTGQPTITTVDTYSYDHMGRLLEQKQKVNSNATELIARNSYDEVGQLVQKQVGGLDKGIGLQNVDYTYNVRGWLKQINNPESMGTDLFAFQLNYNNTEMGISGVQPLFNGNISETIWRTANTQDSYSQRKRGYGYQYDHLNRITAGSFRRGNSTGSLYSEQVADYNVSGITYDKNGNIKSLIRNKLGGTMDNLNYNYHNSEVSNRLRKVTDTSGDVDGFTDGSNTTNEYTYDGNGNLTFDANKGILTGGIKYNHLNLPTEVMFNGSNTQKINYTYSADGIKLRKATNNGGTISTTDYAGNYVYENNNLKQFYQPEGYVEPKGSGWQYVYQYKDIWGNTRITYADDNSSGSVTSAEIRREQNYYPFGLEHKGYNFVSYGAKNNLKTYQGQEFTEDLGLNTHEWKYRMSDPAIGRFWQIDPLAEDYTYNSTYAFQENKLGSGIELEGLENVNWSEFGKGYNRTVQNFNNNFYSNVSSFLRGNPVTETLTLAQNTVTNVAQTAADVTGVSNALGLENQTQQSIEGVVHTVEQFPNMSDDQKGAVFAGALIFTMEALAEKKLPLGTKPLKNQALDLKDNLNGGKNSITIKTGNGQIRYDLDGKAHGEVDTPHKQSYQNNMVDGEVKSVSRTSKKAETMTQQDIRTVRKTIEKRKETEN